MNLFLRKWKKYFVIAGLLSCLVNLLQLTFSFYMFSIYGSVVQSFSHDTLSSITVLAVFSLIFLFFFSLLRSKLLHTAGLALEKNLGQDVFQAMVGMRAGPTKKTYQQGLGDIATLRAFMGSDALFAVFDIPWAPMYFFLIFFFHPTLGLVAVAGGIVTLGLTLLQDRWTRERLARANIRALEGRRFIDTMLNNAEVVNGMGMGPAVYRRFDENNRKIILDQTVASRFAGMAQSSIKSIQIFMNVMIYGLGAWLVIVENFDPGLMIAASIIMGQAISPFMRALFGAKSISQARDAYNRLHDFSHAMNARSVRMSLPAPKGSLRAAGVSFVIDGRVLLYNVSLDLEAGEFLGLIGPNGAGKTTLSQVLLGIWPALSGSVRLDGVDMYQWDKKELGRHVGYLPQTVELFPASVADNIARLGEPDMEEVQRVCLQVGINSLIEELPQGYDTQIGAASGVVFSGGQKQRIGLARALYGSPKLLVLDEPNSNLDEAGEACLLRVLEDIRSTRGATCVIISHKNELLRMVDKMLLLQGGRVVSFGPRDQVLQTIFKASQASSSEQPAQPPLTVRATENV